MGEKAISLTVIKRLPRYYRYLGELLEHDVERISSKELSEKMNVTASQIRQDFNHFGGFGQQGYGYQVEYLHTEIGKILGLDQSYRLVIIGAGNLGQALINYRDFEKRGFFWVGIFDNDPKQIGKQIHGLTVQSITNLENFMKQNTIDIAALTLPKQDAPKMASALIQYGVKAIWNFAPVDLNLPKEITVENVHLAESLMRLSYNIKSK